MGKFNFDNKVDEAFRAGNRARKKESVQDTVESVNDIQAQIDKFREQTGIELEIRDGRPYYDGVLNLKGCTGLTRLPAGLKVDRSLDLQGCTGLISLPDGLTVRNFLDLSNCTGLTELPDRLTAGYCLYLNNCSGLTSLPAGLNVGGLNLENCNGLTSLPADLTISRDDGYICSIPKSLRPFFKQFGIKINNFDDVSGKNWMSKRHLISQIDEAFRAGNRTRKKESVQDTVSDNTDPVINWENRTIGKFMQSRGIITAGDCKIVDDMKMMNLLFGISNLLMSELDAGGPLKFNELRYFTGVKSLTWQQAPELNEITLPPGLEKIIKLSGLDTDLLEIPESVTYISRHAFTGLCARKVRFAGSGRLVIQELAFASNNIIREIESEKTLSFNKWAFAQCGRLKSVKASDILEINDLVFLDCNVLESVDNLRSTVKIGNYAFSGCERLKTISCMSPDLESVGKCAFANCRSLTSAELSAGRLMNIPFSECKSLKRLSIPRCRSVERALFTEFELDSGTLPEGIVIEAPDDTADYIRHMLYMPKDFTVIPPSPSCVTEAFRAGNRARKKESVQDCGTSDMFRAVPDVPGDLNDFLDKIIPYLESKGLSRAKSDLYMTGVPDGEYAIDSRPATRLTPFSSPEPEFMIIRPAGSEAFICIDLFKVTISAYAESVRTVPCGDTGLKKHQTEPISRSYFTKSSMYDKIDDPEKKWTLFWTVLQAFVSGELKTVNDLRDFLHDNIMPAP